MQTSVNAAFASWMIPPWATLILLVTGAVYYRGWLQIRRTRLEQFAAWRLFCFLGALFLVWIAIASPLDTLSGMLLVVHMTQHLLLMTIAPPLVALSAPQVPLLRGLPRFWVREGLGPFFTLRPVHAVERLLKSRLFAWIVMNAAFIAWHLPAAYDLALAHPQLHEAEHACFFLTSVLFWWPIIEPWPVVYKGSRWLLLPYLMSADIVNTALSAFFSFSGKVVYPFYADAPRLFGISALNDQIAAGSLMWVTGSSFFLVPAMWITFTQLSRRGERQRAARAWAAAQAASVAALEALWRLQEPVLEAGIPILDGHLSYRAQIAGEPAFARTGRPSSPLHKTARFDLLALPAVGAFFKSRYGRQSLQAILLLASAAIIVDGFFGHQMSSMNLAAIVPWTYARALFVLALLLVGNLFCMSCPFMLPRELAKKIASSLGFARLPWPRRLRGKWLSVTLLGLFFWAYEAFALWDSPLRTASLLLAYFLTALTLDSIFRGASFCKYVCPLGQFNFVSSLLSPVELRARSHSTCKSCSTRDCIAGNETQRGCELDLFMPLKSGNLDCTLCMDCVKACPHDNIGLYLQAPARELVQIAAWDPQRSSVGRYSRRADLAALALVVVAAAFDSAAVMVAPVASQLARVSTLLPLWLAPMCGLVLAASAPALLCGLLLGAVSAMQMQDRSHPGSVWPEVPASDRLTARGAGDLSLRAQFCRWSLALLPIGLGMWAAHLCFHLITAGSTLTVGLRQAASDLHVASSVQGMAAWTAAHSLLAPDALLQLQLALLDAGLLFALYLGWRMVRSVPAIGYGGQQGMASAGAKAQGNTIGRSLAHLVPWAAVVLLLYAAGVWVLLEPMQMRGMMGM